MKFGYKSRIWTNRRFSKDVHKKNIKTETTESTLQRNSCDTEWKIITSVNRKISSSKSGWNEIQKIKKKYIDKNIEDFGKSL